MKELSRIQQELKAPKGKHNSFGNYKYRSCEDILEAVKPLLGDCSLIINDDVITVQDRFYIKATAILINSNGDKIEATALAREPQAKKGMDEAQITGATSSYARKYALNGLFAIDDTKDSDTQDNTHYNAQDTQIGLEQLIKQTGTNKEKLLAYYKVKELGELTPEQEKKARIQINRKRG